MSKIVYPPPDGSRSSVAVMAILRTAADFFFERTTADLPGASGRTPMDRLLQYPSIMAGAVVLFFCFAIQSAQPAGRLKADLTDRSLEALQTSPPQEGPLSLPESQLEPLDWNDLDGWFVDDHGAAYAAFLASCRPLLRTVPAKNEKRPMYFALKQVCGRALASDRLAQGQARAFFERNFRPVRIAKLGDKAGLLTGYYEPIVDGSRFPTPIFKVPIYRRPPDLVAPLNGTGPGFPNRGKSLRRTSSGELVPFYDRGEILDGALDGQHLEICWIKDQADALLIQLQGSARVRLEDGTILRINYDAHNGYPFVPISRILIYRKIIPRDEISIQRIREWMRTNPEAAEEVRRQNRSFVFFRIVGLSDEREAVGAQGVPLTPGRSIAIDQGLHVYGTPFFIKASLPLTGERTGSFERLMIAQDTGSAIVGPARADIFWGAGDRAGRLAGGLSHPGRFAMLVPRELDPIAAAARIPLPRERPASARQADANTPLPRSWTLAPDRRFSHAARTSTDHGSTSTQKSGCFATSASTRKFAVGRTDRTRAAANANCAPQTVACRGKQGSCRDTLRPRNSSVRSQR